MSRNDEFAHGNGNRCSLCGGEMFDNHEHTMAEWVNHIRGGVDMQHEINQIGRTAPANLNNIESIRQHMIDAHWHEPGWASGGDLEELQQMHEDHHKENADEFEAQGGHTTLGNEHFHHEG